MALSAVKLTDAAAVQDFKFVGDVRGCGLMVGVEFLQSKAWQTPAPSAAANIKEGTHHDRHVADVPS